MAVLIVRPLGVSAASIDTDGDGLADAEEKTLYATDPAVSDTDGDGYLDGEEVKNGYSPHKSAGVKLQKSIRVSLKKQELAYLVDGVQVGVVRVSTGKAKTPTPKGTFAIQNKAPRAWSRPAKLWMPYWMAFAGGGKFGLHELPEWGNGVKEGQDHLGTPVSGGCVRLGVGDAKKLYDWAPVGTPVVIAD